MKEAFDANLLQAQVDAAALGAPLQRVIAYYMTLAGVDSIALVTDMMSDYWGAALVETNYANASRRNLWAAGGADNDLPPDPATVAAPLHNAVDVSVEADLSWTAGARALYHDVYLDTVNPPVTTVAQFLDVATLSIDGTNVDSLAPLAGLQSLITFSAANTLVTNLAPALSWPMSNPTLHSIDVTGAPLDENSLCSYIPELENRATVNYTAGTCPSAIFFTDTGLDTALRTAYGLAASPANITHADFLNTGITTLDLSSAGITDLAGIDRLVYVTNLNLSGNTISNGWDDLAKMNWLTNLNLGNTGISDLSLLTSLTNLQTLDISNNAIDNLAYLLQLPNLTTLNVTGNTLSTPGICAQIEALESRGVVITGGTGSCTTNSVNPETVITDVSLREAIHEAAGSDPQLPLTMNDVLSVVTLDASTRSPKIADLAGIYLLANMTGLILSDNAISDLTPLSAMLQLQRLELDQQRDAQGESILISVSDIPAPSNLVSLTLGSSAISSPEASMDYLEMLNQLYNLRAITIVLD